MWFIELVKLQVVIFFSLGLSKKKLKACVSFSLRKSVKQ